LPGEHADNPINNGLAELWVWLFGVNRLANASDSEIVGHAVANGFVYGAVIGVAICSVPAAAAERGVIELIGKGRYPRDVWPKRGEGVVEVVKRTSEGTKIIRVWK
jgi:hypothetical protein